MSHFIFHLIGPTYLLRPSPPAHFTFFIVFLTSCPKRPSKGRLKMYHFFSSFNVSPVSWWKLFFLLKAAFAMIILYLISDLHLAWRTWQKRQFNYSTFTSWFWSITICARDDRLEILITLVLSPHSLPFRVLFYRFFFSQKHKVICKFYSANYLCFHSKPSKHFNSMLGKVITA